MLGFFRVAALAAIGAALLVGTALAQDLRLFDSKDALDAEIAGHMENGTFSELVDAVAPPSRMSSGRVRILEQAFADVIPSLRTSVQVFRSENADGFTREVVAWWDGETYVFLGLMTHTRPDGVAVLDFVLTADSRRASQWYLTGATQ
jgi:hypothetical protein